MGSNDNGLRQSPFSDAWPTPDSSGTGLNGLGAGLDMGPGPVGTQNSPFDQACCPTPGMEATPDAFGRGPDTISIGGAEGKGANLPADGVTKIRNTYDIR